MMKIQEYVEQKKTLQDNIISFIEDDENTEENFQNLQEYFDNYKIREKKFEIKSLFYLISKISNNYHRSPNFFPKIERILMSFRDETKKFFTNFGIFQIFKNNKRILLFLIEEKMMVIDQQIASIITCDKYLKAFYPQYFYPEIKSFIPENLATKVVTEITENFERNRKNGENEDYLSELIRNDMIEEFIKHIHQANLLLNISVKPSIFETNSILLQKKPNLIEYAAFFGSIQILKYLYINNVEVSPSLWLYAIHSENPEMIHFLEEKKIKPENESFEACMKEAIKCHHNDIANYIQANLLNEAIEAKNLKFKYNENVLSYAFHYFNFSFFPENFNSTEFIFYYLCQFDHYTLVELFLNIRKINLTDTIIISINFF